jgi:hypothetical protein
VVKMFWVFHLVSSWKLMENKQDFSLRIQQKIWFFQPVQSWETVLRNLFQSLTVILYNNVVQIQKTGCMLARSSKVSDLASNALKHSRQHLLILILMSGRYRTHAISVYEVTVVRLRSISSRRVGDQFLPERTDLSATKYEEYRISVDVGRNSIPTCTPAGRPTNFTSNCAKPNILRRTRWVLT